MNNPFSRLKHYLPNKIDPQENHATECLAACLVFSPKIRLAFIRFILSGKIQLNESSEIEVDTQWPIGGGYLDLLLQEQLKLTLVVEVKVKAKQDEEHGKQLENYRKWLVKQNTSNRFLFTLVRDPVDFDPTRHGADGRHTWRDLHKHFQKMLKADTLSEAETSLIKNLCDYLESEGIVTTYNMKDLFNYAAGVKARKAINGVFNQVTSQLEASGFEIRSVEDRKDAWPQLKIRHPEWENIFGKGENWKISLWFTVPPIWDAERHDFKFEIELWHEGHKNDWHFTKSNLPNWLNKLKSKNFEWTVSQTWSHNLPDNIPAGEIQTEPKRIYLWKNEDSKFITENSQQNEEGLVNLLVERVRQYAEIINELKTRK